MISHSIAFFPALKYMSGNPYWPVLVSGLEKLGVQFYDDTGTFTFTWLLNHRKEINTLHLHYCQPYFTWRRGKTHILFVIRFALTLFFARVLGYQTIFTLHNLEPTYSLQPAWVDYLGHWFAVNWVDKVIVHCQAARQLLAQKFGRRSNVYVVDHPNCIDWYPNTVSKELARSILNLPSTSRVFAFLGGIRPNKGVETLIQAFSALEGQELRLVIAGKVFPPEAYAASLQEFTCGDERIVLRLQHIPDDEIQIILNAADVVVLPFSWILTSSSANLAMSFSRPVIVPRMGCLPELVQAGGGWLFDPLDINSLRSVMQDTLSFDLEKAGQRAFETVLPLSSTRFAEQTMKVYWG